MISYAQNFEDVMLWRALKHIENGFYIDVGAWSPDIDSVTRVFYENGWYGINVEPNPEFHLQYLDKRARDINLKVAISNEVGITDIFFSTNPGLSSLNRDIAEGHKSIEWDVIPSKVEVTTLSNICTEHCQRKDIHFLKVDVEGLEKNVLLGNDWGTFRPWIIVVEATLPMSQVENYIEWEYILLEADYEFIYADGLNRFYVAKEHSELKASFTYPPNVFDGFVLANQVFAESRAHQAEQNANEANARAHQAEQSANEANARASQAEQNANEAWQHYHMIEGSNSWKTTKPLRLAGKFARWFVYGFYHWLTFSPTSRTRRVVKRKILEIKNFINTKPQLKSKIMKILDHFPKLKSRLKRIGQQHPVILATTSIEFINERREVNGESINLSPQARKIYNDLKIAIKHQQQERH